MDPRTREHTRREWRDLGFFYDRNDAAKEWLLVGSREGLLRFVDLLRVYVANPRNKMKSEHEHYGPYMYLKVMTWPDPGMDGHGIHGSLTDMQRLATLVERKLTFLEPGNTTRIRDEFASDCHYGLVLELRSDAFDPASADIGLAEGAG